MGKDPSPPTKGRMRLVYSAEELTSPGPCNGQPIAMGQPESEAFRVGLRPPTAHSPPLSLVRGLRPEPGPLCTPVRIPPGSIFEPYFTEGNAARFIAVLLRVPAG